MAKQEMRNRVWTAGRHSGFPPSPGRWALATTCGFILVACQREASGNASQDPNLLAQPASVVGMPGAPSEMGQVAQARDYSLVALEAKACPHAAGFEGPAGTRRIGVRVRITAGTTLTVPVNPFYAQLSMSTGKRFESVLSGCQPALEAKQIRGDESADGWISFDAPEELSEPLTFRYAPIVIGVGSEPVTVVLSGL